MLRIYWNIKLSDEEVAARTDVTLKAANVTQQSTSEVSEQLTAVWNGYKVSAEEAELYVDKLAAVAASTASDLEELSIGMSRVASAASLMGVDVDQLNAQLSTIISVTRQAPESVGTALRSIYARMSDIESGIDTETTLGNYTEEMNQYGINVLNANNGLRDMGEVIEEVGDKWMNMTREQQIGLSQAMAGTRQYNNLLALFDNWDDYTDAIETSRNSIGTLQQQQDIYMESTKAHLQQLETTQEDLFDSLLDPNTINTFADVMTDLTKVVTNFVDALGGGGETLLALGSIGTRVFSNQLAKGIATFISNLKVSKDNASQLVAEMEILEQFKGSKIQDNYLSTLVDMKKEIIDLNDFISEDQANIASAMIKQTNELNNQKVAWKDNLNNLSLYLAKALNLKKVDFSTFNVTSTEWQDYLDVFEEINKKIEQSKKSIEKYKKASEELTNLQANVDNMDFLEYAKKEAEAEKKLRAEIEKLKIEMKKLASNNSMTAESQRILTKAINETEKGLKKKDSILTNVANSALTRYSKAIRETEKDVQEFSRVLDEEAKGASEDIEAKIIKIRSDWEEFIGNIKLVQQVQQVVNLIGAIGQLASAIQTLRNIKNIISDDSLSSGEKLLQIISALSIALPMFISGIKAAGASLLGLAVTLKVVEESEKSVAVAAAAMGKSFWPLLVVAGIIGAVALAIDKLTEAYNEDAIAAEKAAKRVEELTNKYNECKQAAEDLKNSISNYDDTIKALEDLEKNTDEYREALEKANEEARSLIETYELFDNYKIDPETGLISIDKEALSNRQKEEDSEVTRTASRLYFSQIDSNKASLRSEATDILHELGNLLSINEYTRQTTRVDINKLISSEDIQLLASEISQMDEIDKKNAEVLKETILASENIPESIKENLDYILDKSQKSLIDLSNSIKRNAESNEYFAKQILGLSVKARYEEQISELAGEDNARYSLIGEALTQIVNKRSPNIIDDLQNEDLKLDESSYSSLDALNKNYEYNIKTNKELAKEYARATGEYTEEQIKNMKISAPNFFTGNMTAKIDGEEVFKENIDFMSRFLAEASERAKNLDKALESLGEESIKSFGELINQTDAFGEKFGSGFTEAFLAGISNEKGDFDFSSFFNNLDPKKIEELNSLNKDELFNFLGEENLISIGEESADKFYEGWVKGLDQYDPSNFINKALSNAETAQNALDSLSKDKKTTKEIKEEEELLISLGKQYEELAKIRDKTSHEYLATLREIKEEEESKALEGFEYNRNKALKEYQEEYKKLKDYEIGNNFISVEDFEEQLGIVEEKLQNFIDAERDLKIQVDLDLSTDVRDAFGLANELDNLKDLIHDDLYYTLEEVQDLIDQGFGEMFINSQIVAKEIEDNSKRASETMIEVDKEVMNNFIDDRQAELEADRQAKIKQLEDQKILLQAQKDALEQKLSALKEAYSAENAASAASEIEKVKQADETYRAEVEKLNQYLKDEADSADESQNINKTLFDILGGMYEQDSKNQQQAEIDATDTQAGEIQKRLSNVNLLNEAYRGLSRQVQASMKGMDLGPLSTGTAHSGGSTNITGSVEMDTDDIEAAEISLTEFQENFEEYFEQQHEEYLNTINAAIESTRNEINSVEAQMGSAQAGINALKSAYLALDRAQAGATAGGKGKTDKTKNPDKTKDPDKIDYLEDEKDRYHDINLEIEELNINLSRLEKQQNKLYGKDLINNLNKQLDILRKQNSAYKQKIEIAKVEQEEIRKSLSSQGVTFDSDGYINNYAGALQAKLNYVNAIITQYNLMTAEEQENFKEVVETAKEDYEDFKEEIERYDELISSFIPGLEDQIQDAVDKEFEIKISKFTMEVEIRLDMRSLEEDYNEFKRKVVDGIKDDDILGNAQYNLKDYQSYYNTNGTRTGTIQTLTTQINKTLVEIQKIDETGASSVYGDNKDQALEDLEKYYKELTGQMENVVDLVDEIKQSYLDMIDEAVEAFDKQVDQYEYIADIINHDMNLINLLYGDKAYAQLETYYEKMEENNNKELDFLKKRVAYAEEMMNAETDPKAKEKWQEEWMNALESLNKKVEDSVKNLIDKYTNTVNKIFDELNEKVTGGLGLDYVEEEWDLVNKNADRYLDDINAMYEIQKLSSKYLTAIDQTSSASSQKKLNDLMNEQLEMLRDKDKLSQYDIDRANLKYEIMLKQLALEDAQQNKSQMRLRRDSQGNYSYEYVADQDQIQSAQDDLLIKERELYNLDKDKYRENLEEIKKYYIEFQEKYKEIMLDMSLSEEERLQRTKLLEEQYGLLINGLVQENEEVRKNLRESSMEAMEALFKADQQTFSDVMTDTVTKAQMAAMTVEEFCRVTGMTLEELSKATGLSVEELSKMTNSTIKEVLDISGTTLDTFSKNVGQDNMDIIRVSQLTLDEFCKATGMTIEEVAKATGIPIEELETMSTEKIGDITKKVGMTVTDFTTATGKGISEVANAATTTIDDVQKMADSEKDILMNQLVPNWDGAVQNMAEKFSDEGGLIPTCKDALDSLKDATKDYGLSLDALEQAAGIDLGSISKGYDENIDKAQQLLIDNDALIDKWKSEIEAVKALCDELDRLIDLYKKVDEAAEDAAKKAYEELQKQQEAAAEEARKEEEKRQQEEQGKNDDWDIPLQNRDDPNDHYSRFDRDDDDSGSSSGSSNNVDLADLAFQIARGDYNNNPTRQKEVEALYGEEAYKQAQNLVNQSLSSSTGRDHYNHNANAYYEDLKKLAGYDTGGYTGEWNTDNGKIAMLHEKELVLNADDTKNILNAVNAVRNMDDLIDNINGEIMNRILNLITQTLIPSFKDSSQIVEQRVNIEASFPGVKSSNEIEQALNNLVNAASQHAFNTTRR